MENGDIFSFAYYTHLRQMASEVHDLDSQTLVCRIRLLRWWGGYLMHLIAAILQFFDFPIWRLPPSWIFKIEILLVGASAVGNRASLRSVKQLWRYRDLKRRPSVDHPR